jgi:hypothetical protein
VDLDKTTLTGYGKIRQLIFENLAKEKKIIEINQFHWESLKTDEEKVEYLKKLGIAM